MKHPLYAALAALVLAGPVAAVQAPGPEARETPVDAVVRTQVIDGILARLQARYVFPETAKKMETALRERQQRGEYDGITSSVKLAETLTAHLQEVSHDRHLRVRFSAEPIPEGGPREPSAEERRRFQAELTRRNFGVERVSVLPGNVGYLDLRAFAPVEGAAETLAAAMRVVGNTDALIIDLRNNGGGDPATVALLCSYFFERPTHLNDLYWRPSDSTQQFWTQAYVPGPRYVNKDVYLLTSRRTFSAAEEFAYDLKCLNRAHIVGETTGGGAHPGGVERLNAHFVVFIPSGRAINPITKTNWEGTGVTPHVAVPADQALKAAHVELLRKLEGQSADAEWIQELKAVRERIEQQPSGPDPAAPNR